MGIFKKLFGGQKTPPAPLASRLSELQAIFPFPVISNPGESVEGRILSLRSQRQKKDTSIPVIVGDYSSASRMTDMWDEPYDLAEQLVKAAAFSVDEWLISVRSAAGITESCTDESALPHKRAKPMTQLTVGMDYRNRPHHEVFIAEVPASDSTQLPLHLRFGDWNDCPSPFVHAGLARYWLERFGAEILTVAGDIIEYSVLRHPASEEEALELAWQQYCYCPDIVDQGVGSVTRLAEALRESSRWLFWWD